MIKKFKKTITNDDEQFKAINFSIASSDDILKISHGEVTKPLTISYRTSTPENGGLFCEQIFGPIKDYSCACGKYKKVIRSKGIICERCGVEVTDSLVRRERFGHIKLACPIVHIWHLKVKPSNIASVIGVPVSKLEEVTYFNAYVVLDSGSSSIVDKFSIYNSQNLIDLFVPVLQEIIKKYQKKNDKESEEVIDLAQNYLTEISQIGIFSTDELVEFANQHLGLIIGTGADAIKTILENINLEKELRSLRSRAAVVKTGKTKLLQRIGVIEGFIKSNTNPAWMVLSVLPVLPPDIRPIVQLDGGRSTSSDINELYRRIIIRNERLKMLEEQGSPSIIINNEKRMIQEAVDALFDNSRKTNSFKTHDGRELKSLAETIKGKQGRFRQNLLGKRVDYSARSVIVSGPDLRMYECGVPRDIAITLYEPFIIRELRKMNYISSIFVAKKIIENREKIAWEILEKIVNKRPVLLNRAPTLHRLSIQAFEVKLIREKAISLHPLVTTAFNADFDGDQMALHLALSDEAASEARLFCNSTQNILNLKDGKPITSPTLDMALGLYYLTYEEKTDNLRFFPTFTDAIISYENRKIGIHDMILIDYGCFKNININFDKKIVAIITTVGKIILSQAISNSDFFINKFDNLEEQDYFSSDDFILESDILQNVVLQKLKNRNLAAPLNKSRVQNLVMMLYEKHGDRAFIYLDKLMYLGFKYATLSSLTINIDDLSFNYDNQQQNLDSYKKAQIIAANKNITNLSKNYASGYLSENERYNQVIKIWSTVKDNIQNFIHTFIKNTPYGNNGFIDLIHSGARGNVGNITQLRGMRGLMNRPNGAIIEVPITSSFLDGLSDLEFFISCHGARKGMSDTALKTADSGYLTRRLVAATQNIFITEEDCGTSEGYIVKDIVDTKNNTIILPLAKRIIGRFSLENIYDKNNNLLAKENELITLEIAKKIESSNIEKVLTRNVLHCETKNGICQKCYGIFPGNNKIVNIYTPVGVISSQSISEPGTQLTMRTFHTGGVSGEKDITQGLPRIKELFDVTSTSVRQAVIADCFGKVVKIAKKIVPYLGTTKHIYDVEIAVMEIHRNKLHDEIKHYELPIDSWLRIKEGDMVKPGRKLTEGAINLVQLTRVADIYETQKYIIKEVQRTYCNQGIEILDKHIEVILRAMLNNVLVINPGKYTGFKPGQYVTRQEFMLGIYHALQRNGDLPFAIPEIFSIKKVSLSGGLLSAASFQDTIHAFTHNLPSGYSNNLDGMKESVMVGNLIPCGTKYMDKSQLIHDGTKRYLNMYTK